MTLDLPTLYVVGAFGMIVAGVIHLVLVAVGRFGRWATLWGVGHLLGGASAIIAIVNDRSGLAWAPVVANPAVVLGYALITSAVIVFYRPNARIIPILAAAAVLALPFVAFSDPAHVHWRSAYMNLVRAAFDIVVVVVAVRMARRQSLQTGWIVATLFAVTVPLFLGRAWLAYIDQISPPGAALHDNLSAWLAAGQFAFMIFRAFSLLMLQAESGQKTLMDQMERDWLTGTLNRAGLDRVARAVAARAGTLRMVVMMLDVDHFKALNDTQGHAAGDAALRTLAGIVKEVLGDRGHLARWGGDEFVCMLPNATTAQATRIGSLVAARFAQSLSHAVPPEHAPSISFGVANGPATRPIEDLIARADMAMYAAKAGRRTLYAMHHDGNAMRSVSASR